MFVAPAEPSVMLTVSFSVSILHTVQTGLPHAGRPAAVLCSFVRRVAMREHIIDRQGLASSPMRLPPYHNNAGLVLT